MKPTLPAAFRKLVAARKAPEPPAPARPPALPPRRTPGCGQADEHHRAAIAAARALPDGTPASDALVAAIHAEIAARRHAAALDDGPASPALSGLQIRHVNVPDWWESSGSLLLASPESRLPEIGLGMLRIPVERIVIVIGAVTTSPNVNCTGSDALVVIGDRVTMLQSAMSVGRDSTILVGEETTATWMTFTDVRNGGAMIVGADCMIASGVSFMSDDSHAIRDAGTDRRINLRGGRIMIEDHVWIGDQTRIMGDSRIGTGGVVGAAAFVKSIHLPPHTVSLGRPARPARSGIVWTREDAP